MAYFLNAPDSDGNCCEDCTRESPCEPCSACPSSISVSISGVESCPGFEGIDINGVYIVPFNNESLGSCVYSLFIPDTAYIIDVAYNPTFGSVPFLNAYLFPGTFNYPFFSSIGGNTGEPLDNILECEFSEFVTGHGGTAVVSVP